MKRIDRLRQKLEEAQKERMEQWRKGNIILPQKLKAKIAVLEEEIKEEEAYLPKRLSELIDRQTLKEQRIAEMIIKTHIAADYLTDAAMDLRCALKKLGLEGCSLFPLIRDIEKRASDFAAIVCHPDFAGLSDFMVTNERLIDDMHLIVNRYMNEHLQMTD